MDLLRIAARVASTGPVFTNMSIPDISLAEGVWSGPFSMKGQMDGASLEVTGVMTFDPSVVEDEDESGRYAILIPRATFDEGDVVVSVNGQPLAEEDPKFDAVFQSHLWDAAVKRMTEEADEAFREGPGPDFIESEADSASLAKDPYAYYGVRRSDFY